MHNKYDVSFLNNFSDVESISGFLGLYDHLKTPKV